MEKKMLDNLIEFRWLQKRDPGTEEKVGDPVLQWRRKFGSNGDGQFGEFWQWQPWESVPVVDDYADDAG